MKTYSRLINYSFYKLNKDNVIIDADETFEQITGYSLNYIKRHKITQKDLIPEEDLEAYLDLIDKSFKKTGEVYIEHRIKRKDGEFIYVFCLGKLEFNDKGEPEVVVRLTRVDSSLNMLFMEESYKTKLNDLELLANYDNLTGLLRRDPFIETINESLQEKKKVGLLIIDIDDFKNINDTYGHNEGDEVLVNVSKVFKKIVGTKGIIARLGGDEFAVAIFFDKKSEVNEIADNIVKSIESNKKLLKYKVTVSIGTYISNDLSNFTSMYKNADEALYISKSSGKNMYTLCDK